MPPPLSESWSEIVRQTLRSYDETLLRRVAGKLCKPRSQWPAAELIDRSLEVLHNPAALDRRLKDLEPAARQILAAIGHSRQPRWPVGSLVEIAVALGHADGLAPVQALLDAGLIFPLVAEKTRLKHFDLWLGQAAPPLVLAPATVTQRVLDEPLPLEVPGALRLAGPVQETDGLDLPLRLAALWQRLMALPMRRTQQRDLFKRDLDRLRTDPVLDTASADALAEAPDGGLLVFALGLASGVVDDRDGELRPGHFSQAWGLNSSHLVAELLANLFQIEGWNPAEGWAPIGERANPHRSGQLLALLLLATLPPGQFASVSALDSWMIDHHPYWRALAAAGEGPRRALDKTRAAIATGIPQFLLGIAFPLHLLQATKDADGGWAVCLSALGRWAMGYAAAPPQTSAFPQTLLVQPNLEVLVYRQGLTPELIVQLTKFATWRTLGSACTLQLDPESVYRALELGETQSSIVQTLERHGMKPTPPAVLEALKTWSNKRERLTVYPSAVLLEFATPGDLNEALARGLPAVRLTDRLAAVAKEEQIDYKHFRLTGTRDYCLPPEPCVDVEADGVTLSVDLARSDLLLETELMRFTESAPAAGALGRRAYRLTPASLALARQQGLSLGTLTGWFEQRTGLPLPPAVRLLFSGAELPPTELRRRLVLHVPTSEIADGLLQWPATAALIQARLGPTALAVAESAAPQLLEKLAEIGVRVVHEVG